MNGTKTNASVVHLRRGILNAQSENGGVSENESIKSLSDGSHNKFLGAMENTKQDDELSLEIACNKAYILTAPISDMD